MSRKESNLLNLNVAMQINGALNTGYHTGQSVKRLVLLRPMKYIILIKVLHYPLFRRDNMEKISVIIADDHPVFREGLLRVFENVKSLSCIATAKDGEEAVRLVKELRPDVAILDVNMPKITGIDAARLIKKDCPGTAVLMLSAYKYDHYIVSSIQAGVDGYLLKNAPHKELINAIHAVHSGEGAFNNEVAGKVLHKIAGTGGRVETAYPKLGHREFEVLSLAAKGMTNKQISYRLKISENTVGAHFANIFRKLKVESRTEAILSAMKVGLIDIEETKDEET